MCLCMCKGQWDGRGRWGGTSHVGPIPTNLIALTQRNDDVPPWLISSSGLDLNDSNFDTPFGRKTLRRMYDAIVSEAPQLPPGVTAAALLRGLMPSAVMPVGVVNADGPSPPDGPTPETQRLLQASLPALAALQHIAAAEAAAAAGAAAGGRSESQSYSSQQQQQQQLALARMSKAQACVQLCSPLICTMWQLVGMHYLSPLSYSLSAQLPGHVYVFALCCPCL